MEITPIQQAINHIRKNMNGIGIILNESGLSAKEKKHYKTNYECLKITKEYLETLLSVENEYAKQTAIDQRESCYKSVKGVNYNPVSEHIFDSILNTKLVVD